MPQLSTTHRSSFVSTILLLIVISTSALANSPSTYTDNQEIPHVFTVGEELEYKVTYFSFTLGKIVITMDSMVVEHGRNVWVAHIRMDSRDGLPFMSLHAAYETHIDEDGFTWLTISSEKEKDGLWSYLKYAPDYLNQIIHIEQGVGDQQQQQSVIHTPYKYNDGLSLLFYARYNAGCRKYSSVPTLVGGDTSHTIINFLDEPDRQSIDALNYPIACRHIKGTSSATGIYGFSGAFEGWFSDDAAHVPITAKMKIYVGNVWLQLVKWKRPGWNPPNADESITANNR